MELLRQCVVDPKRGKKAAKRGGASKDEVPEEGTFTSLNLNLGILQPSLLSQLHTTMSTTKATTRPATMLSRRQIEGLIAEGQTIIIVDQEVLKVDPWLQYHPGGDKAIKHMVGRDATDEVNA